MFGKGQFIIGSPLIQSRINAFLGHTVMSMEFAHTVLHRQNALNRPAIPQKEPPKPAAAPVKEVAKVSPLPSNNKVVNYHYQQRAHPQEDHDKKVQDYYDKLREQAKPPIIPKREHRHKPPEPLVVVHKPAEKKVSKNPSVDALIEKPPQKLLPKHIEEKPRPVSRHAIEEKPKPKVQPPKPKPPPNFYVPDYKPFRYEDSVKNVAMVVPADKKQDKKPSVSAERKKKLAELKEKARKEEKEKEDQLKEKKKREEEINERMKKREEDRIKMRAEIQRLKKKNRESSGGVGFCLVQKAINGEEGEVVEIKGKDGLVDLKEDKVPVKQEEFVVYKPEPSPEKRPDPYPIPEEVEEKREDVKGLEEIGRETAKFANAELAVKLPEKEKVPDSKVTSKSIRRQVEYLTKSLISRQKAKFKEEEQLEQDMLKLANEYKEVCYFLFINGQLAIERNAR
eukprot:TRINITY_DN720_c0_g1_i1.p1 TRINITY_DN720_c0_g1~~TRINITY_DN720_c0_g1_i1.p1  ORF type:complete len:452 (-),score=92.46 TRINITY_DN720_c0_g1_i1:9756-11111(-)